MLFVVEFVVLSAQR